MQNSALACGWFAARTVWFTGPAFLKDAATLKEHTSAFGGTFFFCRLKGVHGVRQG
jgi:hypothetical protein